MFVNLTVLFVYVDIQLFVYFLLNIFPHFFTEQSFHLFEILKMPEFGQCDDPSCNEASVRLFDCIHHCKKMICLQHLIEHDRIVENNKRQLETIQLELKHIYSIYLSLVDENKIRDEYEQKLNDYKRLVDEVNCLLENNSNDIERFQLTIEKLKRTINEKQKSSEGCPSKKILMFIYLKIFFYFTYLISHC